MGIETELKLRIAPEHLQALKRHAWLRTLSTSRARTIKLYNVYYDTPQLDLRNRAMALRLRRIGNRYVQTLKGGGQASAGLHQRHEWETPVSSNQLEFARLREMGADLPEKIEAHLVPVFSTDFSRTIRLLKFKGALIELAMDSGIIQAGNASRPISELELELKSGSPRQLFKLALALLKIVPLQVEHVSKAGYGYHLFANEQVSPVKGKFPSLSEGQDAHEALRITIAACLAQIQSNLPGVLSSENEEFLHQLRVGMRRLRVVMGVACRHLPDKELLRLNKQLARLGQLPGRVRDWDVFISKTLSRLLDNFPADPGLTELLQTCEIRRQALHHELQLELSSSEFQQWLLHAGLWLLSAGKQAPVIPLHAMAVKELDKRFRKVLKLGHSLQHKPQALQRHALRIACKKLRYVSEMFAMLFSDSDSLAFVRTLAVLQDVLGELNDIAVAYRLIDELENASRRDTLTLVRAHLEDEESRLLSDFNVYWRNFECCKTFWE